VRHGRVVAVEGPSAAGKTTVVTAVAARLEATVVPEAFRRLDPPPSLEFVTEDGLAELEWGLLEEDARRFEEAHRAAASGELVLADTGFLGPITYTAGLVELRAAAGRTLGALVARARALAEDGRWGVPDAVLYLATSPHAQFARARGDPVGHPARLAARHVAVGEIERRLYRDRLAPLWGGRFREVSGDGGRDPVVDRVADAVRGVVAASSRGPTAEQLLAVFGPETAARRLPRGNR